MTATVWALLAGGLTLGSVARPAWAIALYMLTFFAAPHLWWWGKDLPSIRYAFIAGLVLLASVLLGGAASSDREDRAARVVSIAALAMIVNATFVHLLFAVDPRPSFDTYVELIKYVMLFFLLKAAIRDRRDLQLVLVSMAFGAAYIGYEVWWNERGDFHAGRLEGVGAPGADTANALASMLLLVLPLIGSLFINGRWWHKLLVAMAAPLALNVVLLCNSRGAFLGLCGGALVFLLLSRGPSRKKAIRVLGLGGLALYMLLGDPEILERFTTTFVGAEERDRSQASRMMFWKAGLVMLQDRPLGSGGNSFKYMLGNKYLAEVGSNQRSRSLHNGYLTEATDWGVQGLLLKLLFLSAAIASAHRTVVRCRSDGRADDALVGVAFIVAASGFMIISFFGSYMASEWAYWISAFLVRYSYIYAEPAALTVPERAPWAWPTRTSRTGEAVA